jgi:Tol biopolymer transport system component
MAGILGRLARAALRFGAPVAAIFLCGGIALAALPSGAIGYVGTDDQIYYLPQVSAKPQCLTCPSEGTQVRREAGIVPVELGGNAEPKHRLQHYGWPTFSPDATKLAYSSAIADQKGRQFGLWVYDLHHRAATQIFQSGTERVIYLQWIADNRHLSFLLAEPNGLSLMLAQVEQLAPIRIVLTGMPLYFDWNATADRLVVHTAGSDPEASERVTLMSLTQTNQQVEKILSHGRSPFMTPCWSPDGKHLAYIANYHVEANLVVANADGSHPHSIVSLPVGDNSFEWLPDSTRIVYSTTVVPHDQVYAGIRVVDISTAASKVLTKEPVDAYFVSPNGRYLAYIGVPKEKPYYWWVLIDLKTGKSTRLTRFLSTDEEAISYRFFDQFALSHTIWSPDSSAFVFAGVRLLVEPDQSLKAVPPPSVWVMPVDASQPRNVAHGTLAYFSPAAAK